MHDDAEGPVEQDRLRVPIIEDAFIVPVGITLGEYNDAEFFEVEPWISLRLYSATAHKFRGHVNVNSKRYALELLSFLDQFGRLIDVLGDKDE